MDSACKILVCVLILNVGWSHQYTANQPLRVGKGGSSLLDRPLKPRSRPLVDNDGSKQKFNVNDMVRLLARPDLPADLRLALQKSVSNEKKRAIIFSGLDEIVQIQQKKRISQPIEPMDYEEDDELVRDDDDWIDLTMQQKFGPILSPVVIPRPSVRPRPPGVPRPAIIPLVTPRMTNHPRPSIPTMAPFRPKSRKPQQFTPWEYPLEKHERNHVPLAPFRFPNDEEESHVPQPQSDPRGPSFTTRRKNKIASTTRTSTSKSARVKFFF